jgi:hypothetical protein
MQTMQTQSPVSKIIFYRKPAASSNRSAIDNAMVEIQKTPFVRDLASSGKKFTSDQARHIENESAQN